MRRVLFHFVFITTVGLLAADKPWPVFAFQNGVHFSKVQQRIAVLKELGYDGIGSANLNADLPLPQRLKAYDDAGLKLFSFYVGGRLSGNGTGHSYSPAITQALPHLKGRDTFLELYVQGNKRSNTDEQAVAFVQEIADQARAHGVKIVLYPHTGFYIDRLSDAVRIAAADAIGAIGSRTALAETVADSLRGMIGGDASIEVRSAAARALGRMNLGAPARAGVLEAVRVRVGSAE